MSVMNLAARAVRLKLLILTGPGVELGAWLDTLHARLPDAQRTEITWVGPRRDPWFAWELPPSGVAGSPLADFHLKLQLRAGPLLGDPERPPAPDLLAGADGVMVLISNDPVWVVRTRQGLRALRRVLDSDTPQVWIYDRSSRNGLGSEDLDRRLSAGGTTTFEGVFPSSEGVLPPLLALSGRCVEVLDRDVDLRLVEPPPAPVATPKPRRVVPPPAPVRPVVVRVRKPLRRSSWWTQLWRRLGAALELA